MEVFYEKYGQLKFNDEYVGPIDLPEGVTNCSGMFANRDIQKGCYLRNFDTSKVTDMSRMFKNCKIPEGFNLNGGFTLDAATDLREMFKDCVVPSSFRVSMNVNVPEGATTDGMCDMKSLPLEVWQAGKDNPQATLDYFKPKYDFTQLTCIPTATIIECETEEQLLELIETYCAIKEEE